MAERSPLFLGLVRPPKLLGLPIMYAMVWLFGSVLLFVWLQHLAVLGVFLSWFFNIIDLRQALWVLVGIAGVAAAPTIVAAVFGGS